MLHAKFLKSFPVLFYLFSTGNQAVDQRSISASNLQSFYIVLYSPQVLKMRATRRLLSPCATAANLLQPRLNFPAMSEHKLQGFYGATNIIKYDKET